MTEFTTGFFTLAMFAAAVGVPFIIVFGQDSAPEPIKAKSLDARLVRGVWTIR
jgi:hypothetical protein